MVSIIIPIYNAEKFLLNMLESVYNQTYKDYEVILINDGSTDNSLEICREYKEKYNNTKIIDIENKGVSNARNLGIIEAKGEYICFLDSDDEIDSKFLENMLSFIKNNDIGICGYNLITNKKSNKKCIKETESIAVKDILLQLSVNDLLNTLWNKIYLRSLIIDNDIHFDTNITIGEDLLFNVQYLSYCKNVGVTDKILYFYYLRQNGLNLNNKESYFDKINRIEKIQKYINERIFLNKVNEELYINYLFTFNMVDYNLIIKDNKKSIINKYKMIGKHLKSKYYNSLMNQVFYFKNQSVLLKISIYLIKIHDVIISHFILKYIVNKIRRKYN